MTIIRVILGEPVEIELTPTELQEAFIEQEHLYDREDVINRLSELSYDEQPDEVIDEIASLSRQYQDESDVVCDTLWDCVDDAITEILGVGDDYV